MKRWLLAISLIITSATVFAQQDDKLVAGFEFRPIIPSSMFRTGPIMGSVGSTNFTISQKFGYVFGMVVDGRIYKDLEFETGLSFTQRNFSLLITNGDFSGTSSFRIIGYELPVSFLVSIPLSDYWRLNNSLGFALDAFPTDEGTTGTYYNQIALRTNSFTPAFIANTGIKFKTYQSGSFYLGASYHLPFTNIYWNSSQYTGNSDDPQLISPLRGNYFTVDVKYFFPYHNIPAAKKKNKYGGTNNK